MQFVPKHFWVGLKAFVYIVEYRAIPHVSGLDAGPPRIDAIFVEGATVGGGWVLVLKLEVKKL